MHPADSITRLLRLSRMRHRRAPMAMFLVAAALWLLGLSVQVWHQAAVEHVVCPAHGEIVEIGEYTEHDHADQSGWRAAALDSGDHTDGCTLAGASPMISATGGSSIGAPPTSIAELPVLTAAASPRAPPIQYAPKTSPPRSS